MLDFEVLFFPRKCFTLNLKKLPQGQTVLNSRLTLKRTLQKYNSDYITITAGIILYVEATNVHFLDPFDN